LAVLLYNQQYNKPLKGKPVTYGYSESRHIMQSVLDENPESVTETETDGYGYGAEETKSVKREISGKLADDIRTRLGVSELHPVFLTELEKSGWISDYTSDTDYHMIIECGGHTKKFLRWNAAMNFGSLMEWIDEGPQG
jgi:hypothetical protein